MIEDYRGLAVFVAVAEAGGFSAAGRRLKLSTSVVSHHVTKLESKLNTALFYRSTRALSLTAEGQEILGPARRMVEAGEQALDALVIDSDQPVGALRITMPAFGMQSSIHQAIWRFASAHPMVSLSVHTSDRMVDLVREGYDLAIRLGTLADSSLKSRKIGVFERAIVASPAYLASRAPISTLDDLIRADFISLAMLPDSVTLVRAEEEVTITLENSRVEVDYVIAGKAAVLAGLGIQNLPVSEIDAELRSGDLVEVLPEWRLPTLGVYVVWPDSGPQKHLTRRLIDFLAAK